MHLISNTRKMFILSIFAFMPDTYCMSQWRKFYFSSLIVFPNSELPFNLLGEWSVTYIDCISASIRQEALNGTCDHCGSEN